MPYSISINSPVNFLAPVTFQTPRPIYTNSVLYQADLAVTSRLSAAALLYTPEQYKPIFSQKINNPFPVWSAYTRNLSCWASDLFQQLTCCSPYNHNDSITKAGTLITPRHIIYATHYPLTVPNVVRFITADNQIIDKPLLQAASLPSTGTVYPDITIGLLDSDVPESISYCYFLPENYQEYFSPSPNKETTFNVDPRCGVLMVDLEEKAFVGDLKGFLRETSARDLTIINQPTNALKLSAYEDIVFGDSGNPIFLIVDNKLVLIAIMSLTFIGFPGGGGGGANFVYQLSAMNQLIQEVDALEGISTGYTVSTINLSSYTSLSAVYAT